jgi:hypothetical protein
VKESVRISDRNGPLLTGADRFGATGDDSGHKRTILDNLSTAKRANCEMGRELSLGFVGIGT